MAPAAVVTLGAASTQLPAVERCVVPVDALGLSPAAVAAAPALGQAQVEDQSEIHAAGQANA